MRPKNYYDLLGIDPDATDEELRSAYYIRARVIHPDRFDPHSQKREWQKANEMLAELNEAYSVLRDATKRLQYDEVMGYRAASATSGAQRTVRNNEDQTTGSSYEK
ncbi:MAG TPA: J domain-containing protein, partial [Pyrinomonadaceae bacterium]